MTSNVGPKRITTVNESLEPPNKKRRLEEGEINNKPVHILTEDEYQGKTQAINELKATLLTAPNHSAALNIKISVYNLKKQLAMSNAERYKKEAEGYKKSAGEASSLKAQVETLKTQLEQAKTKSEQAHKLHQNSIDKHKEISEGFTKIKAEQEKEVKSLKDRISKLQDNEEQNKKVNKQLESDMFNVKLENERLKRDLAASNKDKETYLKGMTEATKEKVHCQQQLHEATTSHKRKFDELNDKYIQEKNEYSKTLGSIAEKLTLLGLDAKKSGDSMTSLVSSINDLKKIQ